MKTENVKSEAAMTTLILGTPNPTKTQKGLDGTKSGHDRAPGPGPELMATQREMFLSSRTQRAIVPVRSLDAGKASTQQPMRTLRHFSLPASATTFPKHIPERLGADHGRQAAAEVAARTSTGYRPWCKALTRWAPADALACNLSGLHSRRDRSAVM